jgi:thioredoxin-related protein
MIVRTSKVAEWVKNSWEGFRLSVVVLLLAVATNGLSAQAVSRTFSEVNSLQTDSARLHLVVLRTDWCRFCHQMEARTFQDPAVAQLLNTQYYFTIFDAESSEQVVWADRTFGYEATGRKTGVHQLAKALGTDEGGRLSYPTLVLLNERYEVVFRYAGFLGAKELREILAAGTTYKRE